jgi:hypothetical protein
MTAMTRLHVTTTATSVRRAAALSKARAVRDLAADWKRWTLAERITAVVLVSLVVLAVLAASTALASGGH